MVPTSRWWVAEPERRLRDDLNDPGRWGAPHHLQRSRCDLLRTRY
nr:MAG TPA: hypothetical protein [Caudoviricetes sp.]